MWRPVYGTVQSGAGRGLCPLFLLFLDSVRQLGLQFPSQLQFRPAFLADLWDTTLTPVFDTFVFDCEHDRAIARTNNNAPVGVLRHRSLSVYV